MQLRERIERRGDAYCVVTADGSRTLGCHDTRAKAAAQLAAIEASKAREAVREVEDPGFFRHCMATIAPKADVDDPEAFCAWLHKQLTGIWPAEHEAVHGSSYEERSRYLHRALADKFGGSLMPTDWFLEATFEDHVIVVRGEKRFSMPYTVNRAGEITFGEEAEVAIVYEPLTEGAGHILGPLDLREGEPSGHRWAVVILEEGISRNRNRYRREVLEAAAPKYESARVFWDHAVGGISVSRSAKDLAGFISEPAVALLESRGRAASRAAITGILNVTSVDLRQGLLEAWRLKRADLYGLSHDVKAKTRLLALPDGAVRDVEAIEEVHSVDVVAFPSAGGRVMRLVAGNLVASEEDLSMFETQLALLKETRPDLAARLGATPTEAEVTSLLREAMTASRAEGSGTAQAPGVTLRTAPAPASQVLEAVFGVPVAEASTFFRDLVIDRAFQGRTMPDRLKTRLTEDLRRRPTVTLQEAQSYIDGWIQAVAPAGDAVRGSGLGTTIEVGTDQADTLKHALDGLLQKQSIEKVPPFRSIREAYIQITGDRELTQRAAPAAIGRFARMWEVQGITPLRESLATTDWAEIFGDSVRRAMLADYRTIDRVYDSWRKIVSQITPAADFRTMRRMRVGGYGDLSTVAQRGTYPALTSPTDEEATFSIAKKGGVDDISWEMIVNDDVGAVRRIPTNLARAAKRTLYKGVFDLLNNNSNVSWEAVALAAASHNNLIATALSQANASTARRLMVEQTSYGGNDQLNLPPRYLVVPSELEELAFRLTRIPVVAITAQTATEQAFQREVGPNEYITVPYWIDVNNYWFVADPADIETIEVAFFQGREEPELFIQDEAKVGSVFTADKITYKIRFIYGVVVLDHRGFVGGIV